MHGDDRAIVDEPHYDDATQEIRLARNLSAQPISPAAWAYQQGAYPVLRDYLNTRRGRRLSSTEFADFRRLAAAVHLTIARLPLVDELLALAAQNAIARDELGDTLLG